MKEGVGFGGLRRRQTFRGGSYAAATLTRLEVAPPSAFFAERPKTIICRPVQTLARPPSFGAIGAFGRARQVPERGLAAAVATGAIASIRRSASRFMWCSLRSTARKISRTG